MFSGLWCYFFEKNNSPFMRISLQCAINSIFPFVVLFLFSVLKPICLFIFFIFSTSCISMFFQIMKSKCHFVPKTIFWKVLTKIQICVYMSDMSNDIYNETRYKSFGFTWYGCNFGFRKHYQHHHVRAKENLFIKAYFLRLSNNFQKL